MGLLMPDALDAFFDRLPEVLSIEQCAEALGIRPKTVYRRLVLPDSDPRKIPGYKPGGGSWVILREEIREYVRRGANVAHPDEQDDLPPG